jgi:hypothetical protein
MIFHEHKCIFVRVPKTGTWSIIEKLVEGTQVKAIRTHTPVTELQKIYPEYYDQYKKIGFVRNPWDRLVSAFFHIKRGGMCHDDIKKKLSWVDPVNGSFERFVKETLVNGIDDLYNPNVLLPQVYWLYGRNGNELDLLGKFEKIDNDWLWISREIGLKYSPLHKVNASEHKTYKDYYDKEMIDIVARFYTDDITEFNYDF